MTKPISKQLHELISDVESLEDELKDLRKEIAIHENTIERLQDELADALNAVRNLEKLQ